MAPVFAAWLCRDACGGGIPYGKKTEGQSERTGNVLRRIEGLTRVGRHDAQEGVETFTTNAIELPREAHPDSPASLWSKPLLKLGLQVKPRSERNCRIAFGRFRSLVNRCR